MRDTSGKCEESLPRDGKAARSTRLAEVSDWNVLTSVFKPESIAKLITVDRFTADPANIPLFWVSPFCRWPRPLCWKSAGLRQSRTILTNTAYALAGLT